jgi:hypothetical protein
MADSSAKSPIPLGRAQQSLESLLGFGRQALRWLPTTRHFWTRLISERLAIPLKLIYLES